MANTKKSQHQKLVTFLRKTGRITAKQALSRFGTKNLRARISDLRSEGWVIQNERNKRDSSNSTYRVISAA